jgi:hypothetical protein
METAMQEGVVVPTSRAYRPGTTGIDGYSRQENEFSPRAVGKYAAGTGERHYVTAGA